MNKIAATVVFVSLLGWVCWQLLAEEPANLVEEGPSSMLEELDRQDARQTTAVRRDRTLPPIAQAPPESDVYAPRQLRVFAEDDTELTQASVRFHSGPHGLYLARDMVPFELLSQRGLAGGENVAMGHVQVAADGTLRLRGRITGRVLVDGSPLREMVRIGVLETRPTPFTSDEEILTYCEVYTEVDGTFRIDNIPNDLKAALRCDVAFRRADDGAPLTFDGPAENVVIELTRRPRITATLRDAKERPVAGADVVVNSKLNVHRTDVAGLLQFTVPASGYVRMEFDGKVLWKSVEAVDHDIDLGVLRVAGSRSVRVYVYDADGVSLEGGVVRSGGKTYLRDEDEWFIRARLPADAADFVVSGPGHQSTRFAVDDRDEFHVRLGRSVHYVIETWTRRGLTGNLPVIVRAKKALPPRLNCVEYLDEKTAIFKAQQGRVRVSGLTSDDEVEAFPVSDMKFLVPLAEARVLRRTWNHGIERFDVRKPGLHTSRTFTVALRGRSEASSFFRVAVGGPLRYLPPRLVYPDDLSWKAPGVVREVNVRVEELDEKTEEWKTRHERRYVLDDRPIVINLR